MRGCECATCEGARAYSRSQTGAPHHAATKKRWRDKASQDELYVARARSRERAKLRARADARDAARLAEFNQRSQS